MKFASVLKILLSVIIIVMNAACDHAQNISFEDVLKLPQPAADQRVAYGADPSQFGDLRLPKGEGKFPVIVVIHGGCWFSEYDLNHLSNFSDQLTQLGAATWSLEYRRIGNAGGGWPGTFEDAARGIDYLRVLAEKYPLDLSRVIVVGHSAGGQLAFWLAARGKLPADSPLYSKNPLPVHGVVSLAGIPDLRKYRPDCDDSVTKLLGGSPEEFPDRYAQTSPIELLPLKIPQILIHGDQDPIVPVEYSKDYAAQAQAKGDPARAIILENTGHFDLISPQTKAWSTIEDAVRSLLKQK